MKLYTNNQEVDYNKLDNQICTHFNAINAGDSFCVIPNNTGYLSNIDWYSILAQAESCSKEEIISFYNKDFEETLKVENKELKDLIPQLFKLFKFFKSNNISIGC